MIGTTLERVNGARDSSVRSLAFFLVVSVFVHGAFFPQEWVLLGAGIAFYQSWCIWSRWFTVFRLAIQRRGRQNGLSRLNALGESKGFSGFTLTDGLFFILIGLSFIGLWHPVKASEGWIDAVRWGTLWMVYRQARNLRRNGEQERMLRWIQRVGIFLAVFAWLPRLSQGLFGKGIPFLGLSGMERLSSFLGYPNALAVYLAAILLTHPRSKLVRALLLLSLLNTGSRATISLFLLMEGIRQILKIGLLPSQKRGRKVWRLSIVWALMFGLGLLSTFILNPSVGQRLVNWSLQNSLGERLLYFRDGLKLAWFHQGMPQAGGWQAFPLIQDIPYWTNDPHSVLIHVLLNQGIYGLLAFLIWGMFLIKRTGFITLLGLDEHGWEDFRAGIRSALVFLGLHALIDADFLFGTLGILFWTLLGLFAAQEEESRVNLNFRVKPQSYGFRSLLSGMSSGLKGVFFLVLGFALLGGLVYPERLGGQTFLLVKNERAEKQTYGAEQATLEGIKQSLVKDQTQNTLRREGAQLEIRLNGAEGLQEMEEVLAWEKFNLRAYEWAQGVVLNEAEKRRATDSHTAALLYQWCEKVPSRLIEVSAVNNFERSLWAGAKDFQPSELMNLLANTAKERQLTLH